jgi:hypothetical protein
MKREEAILGKRVICDLIGLGHTSGTIADDGYCSGNFAVIWDDEPYCQFYYKLCRLGNIHEHP